MGLGSFFPSDPLQFKEIQKVQYFKCWLPAKQELLIFQIPILYFRLSKLLRSLMEFFKVGIRL